MSIEFLQHVVGKNGPEPHQYGDLNSAALKLHQLHEIGELDSANVNEIRQLFGDAFSIETMQGFALTKPHGYAGDFELIDRIYLKHKTKNLTLRNWDKFFHDQPAARAVRNRKQYFSEIVDRTVDKFPEAEILNIASGPGRCMKSWMDNNPNNSVKIDCIELDPNAIEYSKQLNRQYLNQINFERKNLLRYEPKKRYSLIWASGIFDYFDDDTFRKLVHKLLPAVESGGSMVIGNFAEGNPNRPYMELFGEWVLHHRSKEQLVNLCSSIGEPKNIWVESEAEGVNHFLHIEI